MMKSFDCLKDWSCLLMFRDAGIKCRKWKWRLCCWFWRRSHQELQSQGMYSTLLNPRPWSASDTRKKTIVDLWMVAMSVFYSFIHVFPYVYIFVDPLWLPQLFTKRYYKTKHGTYVPTLREYWKPGTARKDLMSIRSKRRWRVGGVFPCQVQ